jgi:hypothetical protein
MDSVTGEPNLGGSEASSIMCKSWVPQIRPQVALEFAHGGPVFEACGVASLTIEQTTAPQPTSPVAGAPEAGGSSPDAALR